MKKIFNLLLLTALFAFHSFTEPRGAKKQEPLFITAGDRWVDSVFNSLTPDERLGQLFMVAAYSNKDLKHVRELKELIVKYNIGGLIWMQGGPVRQGKMANYFQSIAKTPLLYSIDGEWGLAMRLDSTPRYPKQMTLGAIRDDSLIYKMGRQIALECRRMGIHVNFAPVADINNNPMNPVIGVRSFGENKIKVAQKSFMYMQGMQDQQVMANGKHFPGHGDTDSDSHKTLPYIGHSVQRLDSLELYPFRYLFDRGLASVMVAHLNIPGLDSARNMPSTLSRKIVSGLLKEQMGFRGLIFTDALSMKGVTNYYAPGIVDVKALAAGNDVLLFSENVPKAMHEIRKAIAKGEISREDVDARCKKILHAKYWCGLNAKPEIVTRNLAKELNTQQSNDLNDRLAQAAITLLKNENNFLPLRGTDTLRIAEVSIGVEEVNQLGNTLRNFTYVEHIGLSHDATPESIAAAFQKISSSDIVVMQINKATLRSENNYGMGGQTLRLIDSIASMKPSVLVIVANPYLLNKIPDVKKYRAIVVSYEYIPSLLKASANALLGVNRVNGRLPVSTIHFPEGSGLDLEPMDKRKRDELTESLTTKKFGVVDSLALYGIAEKAYPGCQVVAMLNGEVIYEKSYGNYTYSGDAIPVTSATMYDLASITKIASTSLALMKLRTEGKFDYKKTLGDYLPYLQGTNKASLVIEDVLSHQAGLQAWIPFYLQTLEKKGDYKPGIYSKEMSKEYPIQVAKDLYISVSYRDSVYKRLIDSKVEPPGKYLYSDLGYYFMQQIIEELSGKKLDDYVHDIYAQLGIGLRYHPLKYFSKLQVAPTENDEKFRKQIVQGHVHDPGAALLGGVAGHAGLFGNAVEVAELMQLFLNKGELNGVRIIDSSVVTDFTSCHFCPGNRRGLCFEKPEPDLKKENPVNSECSLESFGHSGFTGTFAWADPKNKLIVVFLSNRVFPNAEDNKLTKLGIRGRIHKAFYDALKLN
jgi:beta-N-acetylhexosaminidase